MNTCPTVPAPHVPTPPVTVMSAGTTLNAVGEPESSPPPPQAFNMAAPASTTTHCSEYRFIESTLVFIYRAAARSLTTFGVMKISSSVLDEVRCVVLNRLPRYGTSPRKGTLV